MYEHSYLVKDMAVKSQRGIKRKIPVNDVQQVRQIMFCNRLSNHKDTNSLDINDTNIAISRTYIPSHQTKDVFVSSTFLKTDLEKYDSRSALSDDDETARESAEKDYSLTESDNDMDTESNSINSDSSGALLLLNAAQILASRFEINSSNGVDAHSNLF